MMVSRPLGLLLVLLCLDARPSLDAFAEGPSVNPSTSSTASTAPGGVDLLRLISVQSEALGMVASDADALALFSTKLGPASALPEIAAILRPTTRLNEAVPAATLQSLQSSAVRFTAALGQWSTAQAVRQGLYGPEDLADKEVWTERQKHIAWLAGVATSPFMTHLRLLLEAEAWSRTQPGAGIDHPGYDGYRAALDRAYPDVAGTDASWLAAIEQDGVLTMKQRLISDVVDVPMPENARGQMAARYAGQRIRPVVNARIQALLAEWEREAVVRTYAEWTALRAGRDQLREAAGLKRLCGSWQWIIHNHRNHGDHKTVMVFAPAGTEGASQNRPKETVVLGDAVYLRWELPGGVVQEDSLLFVGEGKRLEGSFVSSGGSWGSITGKRVQACKP